VQNARRKNAPFGNRKPMYSSSSNFSGNPPGTTQAQKWTEQAMRVDRAAHPDSRLQACVTRSALALLSDK
jgi:hypothetical protein